MKKTTKIVTSILTIGTMTLSLAGCGSGASAGGKSLTGSWNYKTSLGDIMEHDMDSRNKELYESDTINTVLFDTVGSDTIEVNFTFTFNEDGTCSLVGNTDEVNDNIDKLVEENRDVLVEKLLNENANSDTFANEEDMLQSYVSDWESLIGMDFISTYETGYSFDQTCNYTVKDGSLYISADSDTKVDDGTECYGSYTISDNTLEIKTEETDWKPATDWKYTKK